MLFVKTNTTCVVDEKTLNIKIFAPCILKNILPLSGYVHNGEIVDWDAVHIVSLVAVKHLVIPANPRASMLMYTTRDI